MQTIAIINEKGGTAKTTTAEALAAGLKNRGFRVLSIDLDAQRNLTKAFNAADVKRTISGVLMQQITAPEAITHTRAGDIIAADKALKTLDIILTDTGKEYRLRESLEGVKNDYDFVILDNSPKLGIAAVNALTAADRVIIPSNVGYFALAGMEDMVDTIASIRKYCNPGLLIDGVLITMADTRTKLTDNGADIAQQIAAAFGTKVYKTRIRRAVAIERSQYEHESVINYAPTSNAAKDYNDFIDEFLEGLSDHEGH